MIEKITTLINDLLPDAFFASLDKFLEVDDML